jgi:hypothetical protein
MRVLGLLLALPVLACAAEPVAPGLQALSGQWRSATESLQPTGSMDRLLVVSPEGLVQRHVISRGVHYGQPADQISAHMALFGRIDVRGDKYVIHPDSEVTEDLFYGPSYRSVQRTFAAVPRDTVRYQIIGDELRLAYTTYPADAPVLTTDVLHRVR